MHVKHETNHIKPQQSNTYKENKTENTTNNCSCHVKETCPVDEKMKIKKIRHHMSSYSDKT